MSPEWAERVLVQVEAVVGSSGPWNAPSPHADAFQILLELPADSAATAFRRIYQNAHAAGKVYALSGLREVGATEFSSLLHQFEGNRDWVLVWQHDEISCARAGEFARGSETGWPPDIASGAFATWVTTPAP